MKKLLMVLVPLLLIGFIAAWLMMRPAPQPAASRTPGASSLGQNGHDCERVTDKTVTITYTSGDEFSPSCVTVAAGTAILWDNQSSREVEVGADPHPIHSGDRAISNGEFVLSVPAHGKVTEVINKAATYNYHNHVNASATGKLIVE